MQRTLIRAWLLMLAAPVVAYASWIDLERSAGAERVSSTVSAFRLSTLLRTVKSEALEWESPFASLTVLRATPPAHP